MKKKKRDLLSQMSKINLFTQMTRSKLQNMKRIENFLIVYIVGIFVLLSINVFLFTPTNTNILSIAFLALFYILIILALMLLYSLRTRIVSKENDEENLKKIKQDINKSLDEDQINHVNSESNEKNG